METNDLIHVVNGYLPRDDYFFLSSVSSAWRDVYTISNNKETNYSRAIESSSRMKACLDTEECIHASLCTASCMTRNMKALKWLCRPDIIEKFSLGGPSLESAAYGGSDFLDIVLDCFNHKTNDVCVRYEITMGCIRSGDITMLEKWWKGLTYYWHGCVLETAGVYGTIELLDWALDKGFINKKSKLLVSAGEHSRNDIIKWCYEKRILSGLGRMIQNASRDGNVSVLDLSVSFMRLEVVTQVNRKGIVSIAARYGQINVLLWAQYKEFPFGPEAYIGAAFSGKYVSQSVVIKCLEVVSSVIGNSSISWLLSTIKHGHQKGECEGETLEWFTSRI